MLYIGIPTINLVDHLERAVDSIRSKEAFELLVVNNGDEKEYTDWARAAQPAFHQILNAKNKGVSASWNQIIDWALIYSDCEAIYILNDDIILHPDCIDKMIETIRSERYLAVSAAMVAGPLERMQEYNINSVSERYVPGMHFSCFAVTPKLVAKIGKIDERYGLSYVEDTDYFYRMEKAKVRKGCDRYAWFTHYRVRDRRIGDRKASHKRNRGYFTEKWNTPPGATAHRMMAHTRI